MVRIRRVPVPGHGYLTRNSIGSSFDADPAFPAGAGPDGLVTGVILAELGASSKGFSLDWGLADDPISRVTDVVEYGLANRDCPLVLAVTAIPLVIRVKGSCIAGGDGGLGQSQGGKDKSSLHLGDRRNCQESERKRLGCLET